MSAVVKKLKEWINDPKYGKIVIAGSAKLSNLIPFVERNCREGCSVVFVVEPTHGYLNTNVPEGTNIIHGTVVALEGDKFLQKVIVEDEYVDSEGLQTMCIATTAIATSPRWNIAARCSWCNWKAGSRPGRSSDRSSSS